MAREDADTTQPNWLEMSDEEMLKAPVPDFSAEAAHRDDKDELAAEDEAVTDGKNAAGDDADDDKEGTPDEGDKEPAAEGKPGDAESEGDAEEEADDKGKKPAAKEGGEKEEKPQAKKEGKDAEGKKEEKKAPEAGEIDYATAGKELLAPFKANGREVQVRSVEDARALMQMGANYNKKMAALKPNLRLMKMLENNGLLDEGKLNFLIDLSKKDQGAINKLVKDSGLNPMDLDAEKAGDYKPGTHSVDEREVELDNVLTDLEGSAAYARTLEIVGSKWDQRSKNVIAQNPQLLQVLHDHVDRGIYDLIAAEVERERTFGRIPASVSDIDAYRQVGDAIQDRGGFNHLGRSQGKASTEPVVVEPKPKSGADDKRDAKRKALGSPKPAAPAAKPDADFNPLGMSDEEFEKQARKRFR